jgi:hypothetical protein
MHHIRNRARAMRKTNVSDHARTSARIAFLFLRRAGLCQIQPFFRRNALYPDCLTHSVTRSVALGRLGTFPSARYSFWALNRYLLHQLYFLNRRRRHFGRRSASSPTDADAFTRTYGSAAPSSLPESTEWCRGVRNNRPRATSIHICSDKRH